MTVLSALADQLDLEAEGRPGVVEPGHAAVRFSDPTTGGDVLPTMRAEMHRLRPGTLTATRREVGT
jgi:gentisate 1,2-dioxygenase